MTALDTLREMRNDYARSDLRHQVAALDAAIAALEGQARPADSLEAGRSVDWMDEVLHVVDRWCRPTAEATEAIRAAMLAAAPQQPPPAGQASPVGVTDGEIVAALDTVIDAANDARNRGDEQRTKALVSANVVLRRAINLSQQEAAPSDDELQAKADASFAEYVRGD